jgi:hypothetical protein
LRLETLSREPPKVQTLRVYLDLFGFGVGVGVVLGLDISKLKYDAIIGKVVPWSSVMTDILPPTPGVAAVVFSIVYFPGSASAEMEIVTCVTKYDPLGSALLQRAPRSVLFCVPFAFLFIGSRF